MTTDSISDFLTRLRNATTSRIETVEMPSTNILVKIAEILKKENFIDGFEVITQKPQNRLRIKLKYVNGESAITGLRRVSKPGRRIYVGYDEVRRVRSGYGIAILSTPQGVITDKQVRRGKVAGEYLCEVY
jgi:small subunit ribosomal protein S8